MYTGILLYPRFSEYELSVVLSVLKQGEKPIVMIGLDSQTVTGEAGMRCVPEVTIDEVDLNELDSIVMPGVDDFEYLVDHSELSTFLCNLKDRKMFIGAISSAPYLLSMSGVLGNRKFTTGLTKYQREFLGTFKEENYVDSPVVIDDLLLTAKGSAFVEFAIQYGEMLKLNFDENWYRLTVEKVNS